MLISFTPRAGYALGLLLGCSSAVALADSARVLSNPPLMPIKGAAQLLGAEQAAGSAAEKQFTWYIKETDNRLYNPTSGAYDRVKLRSYQGTGINPNAPFVAPTIEIRPGDTVRATLNNQLAANSDPACLKVDSSINTPQCFNTTNMHAHGLWISPAGNSDNVLLSIKPGVSFQYEYNIPADHPAGTFWYHPHQHGSTAIQVASGMAGALLIKGDRLATDNTPGDLDTVLEGVREQVMVFQQIPYDCREEGAATPDYNCTDKLGSIPDYGALGFGKWGKSGRYTSINGQVLPLIQQSRDEVVRWRMIHAGIHDTLNLSLRKATPKLSALLQEGGTTPKIGQLPIEELCTATQYPQFLMAADGLTLRNLLRKEVAVFQPGYRWDSLVAFDEGGDYCLVDEQAAANANVGAEVSPRVLLGVVQVTGQSSLDRSELIARAITTSAQKNYPAQFAQITQEVMKGSFARFTPHSSITDQELTSKTPREAKFNIDKGMFMINDQPFKPGRIDHNLVLGDVEEWTLTSDRAGHPFHIHVNPFEIVKILDPKGKDVSAAGAVDGDDPQYPGLKGVFKDTIWVKEGYKVIIRTRYQRYIGDFVLHCHILDHEDQGMMQNVRISLPDGQGGASHSHH